MFERGQLVFVFNFHPETTYDGYGRFYTSQLATHFLSFYPVDSSGPRNSGTKLVVTCLEGTELP